MLTSLYAFAIEAQKGEDPPAAPVGGPIGLVGPLGTVVDRATSRVQASNWLDVNLHVDSADPNRTHPVRVHVITLAFSSPPERDSAAEQLALRLSISMDQRMKGCLLAISVEDLNGGRAVTLWTFPRDEALRFVAGGEGHSDVEVLQDSFSQRSHLRKAAILRGADKGTTSFLTATVADLQTGGGAGTADYWIHDFLEADLSLAAGIGSVALARGLKQAWDEAPSEDIRDDYYGAAMAIRASTATRTSLKSFADTYLIGEAKAGFLKTKEAREHRGRQFQFDAAAFERVANFRILRTANGLRISAPFADANGLLEFNDIEGGNREVVARGTVIEDKVGARP